MIVLPAMNQICCKSITQITQIKNGFHRFFEYNPRLPVCISEYRTLRDLTGSSEPCELRTRNYKPQTINCRWPKAICPYMTRVLTSLNYFLRKKANVGGVRWVRYR